MPLPRGLVWITGASSGIGWATALLMARRGWDVAASARNVHALDALMERHDAIRAYPLDVTDPVARVDIYEKIRNDLGPVDVLVNNAGYGLRGAVEEMEMHEIRSMFDLNLFAPIALSKLVLPEMRTRRSGRIINISSVVGRVAFPISGIYSSSKFALEGMSDALRMELMPWGVKVILVEPGPIRTRFAPTAKSMSESRLVDEESDYAPYYKRLLGGAIPSKNASWGASSVADVIRLAAETDRPKDRYPVHTWAQWAPVIQNLLPRAWLDKAFGFRFGLTTPASRP